VTGLRSMRLQLFARTQYQKFSSRSIPRPFKPIKKHKHYPLCAGRERYFRPARLHPRHNPSQKHITIFVHICPHKPKRTKKGSDPFFVLFLHKLSGWGLETQQWRGSRRWRPLNA
jgi:hypothetical protein